MPDSHIELSERKKQILKAIIDVHIRLGEPVGSKYLTQEKQISLSSATIRNEMAELETMGYLEQPHTSAGRIPSKAGYRLYVDSLMNRYPISVRETEEVDALLKSKLDQLDKVLDRAGKLVSGLTNYATVTFKTGTTVQAVRRFDAVLLTENSFILVMTVDDDTVHSKNVHVTVTVTADSLLLLTKVLNRNIAGLPMEQINLAVIIRMENELGADAAVLSAVMKCVYDVIGHTESGDLHLTGVNKLLEYPEFSDLSHMREMFETLDKKEEIMEVMTHDAGAGVHVCIGDEAGNSPLSNSTLVYRTLTEEGRVVGAIGVIGPCRMDYAKVVSLLEYMAGTIEGKQLPPPDEKQ